VRRVNAAQSTRFRIVGERHVDAESRAIPLDAVDGQPLVVTRLKRPGKKRGVPLVLLHGLGQNRYSWHMESMSMAAGLVAEGFAVYLAELRGHGLSANRGSRAPGSFDDYVFRDVPAILRAVHKDARRPAFLVGHSLGGTIAYALDPTEQAHLAGIVSIAGPSHFGRGMRVLPGIAGVAVRVYDALKLDRLPQRDVPIGFHTGWFVPLFRLPLFDRGLVRLPLALWVPGSMEPHVLEERLVRGFDRTGWEIVKTMVLWMGTGRFLTKDRGDLYERHLAAKDVPILFVTGNRDAVVPAESVRPAYEAVRSADRTYREFGDFGHLDLIFGRRAPEHVWPAVAAWMRERA
jgi:alpha-beta hydrolase superfamily lysophospholipase